MVMTGQASYRLELFFTITFLGLDSESYDFPAILDTGFTGMLTIPPSLIQILNPVEEDPVTITLGDGTERLMPCFTVPLLWEGQRREVQALEAEGLPLIGVRLLKGMVAVLHLSDGGDAMLFRP